MPPPPSRSRSFWPSLKRALRAPRLVVAELLVLALAGVALASVPQLELPLDLVRHEAEHPLLAPLAHALALDRILHSPWLWLPLAGAMASLAAVLADVWPRTIRLLRFAPGPSAFDRAAYRAEFVRPARGAATVVRRRGRLGHLGSPLFHTGLAVIVVAGLVRALFGRDAVVDLVEGETLAPSPSAYGAQWGGPLSRPLALPAALRLDGIRRDQYASGALRSLSARAALLEPGGARPVGIAINAPLDVAGTRVYLQNRNGVAAIVRVAPGAALPTALLLEEQDAPGVYEARSVLEGGLEVIARATAGPGGALPSTVELRVLRRGALALLASFQPGAATALPDGRTVAVEALRRWGRFEVTRDAAAPLAFAGIGLAVLGAVVLVGFVPFDTAVVVTPAPEGERVCVVLRPHRLPAVFEDRFERLVRSEGGSPSP